MASFHFPVVSTEIGVLDDTKTNSTSCNISSHFILNIYGSIQLISHVFITTIYSKTIFFSPNPTQPPSQSLFLPMFLPLTSHLINDSATQTQQSPLPQALLAPRTDLSQSTGRIHSHSRSRRAEQGRIKRVAANGSSCKWLQKQQCTTTHTHIQPLYCCVCARQESQDTSAPGW